jgi:hypothetical protein
MTDQLRPAPRRLVNSPTYRLLKGELDEREYRRILDAERVRYGLPPLLEQPSPSHKQVA